LLEQFGESSAFDLQFLKMFSAATGGTEGLASSTGAQQLSPGPAAASRAASTAAGITTTAAADSSDVEKKIKDNFVKEMSKVIVKILNYYRNPGVIGHISSTQDFKHLAKKVSRPLTILFLLMDF
jgi:hypothetical protein